MSTNSRQDALLAWLKTQELGTVSGAARHLKVSVRTVHRDITALRSAGVHIEGAPGRGGGLRVLERAPLADCLLEDEERAGLVLSVFLARMTSEMPFGDTARVAIDRIAARLPSERADRLRRFLGRTVVGLPLADARALSLLPVDPTVLPAIERAFSRRCALALEYITPLGGRQKLRVEPHGLLIQQPVLHLLAHHVGGGEPGLFRLDRLRGPSLMADVTFQPRSPELIAALAMRQVMA